MKHKISVLIVSVLVLATLVFIWSNSLQSVVQSQERSISIMNKLEPLLEVFVGRGNVTDHLVRKLAHFTEFGALGIEFALLLIFRRKVHMQPIVNCLFAGFATAAIDETIQIFTGRGSQVQDVWLDFTGTVTGIFISLLVFWVIKAIYNKNSRYGKMYRI